MEEQFGATLLHGGDMHMGMLNDELKEGGIRVDDSALLGYLVTLPSYDGWHIVTGFEDDGIHLLCSDTRITRDDDMIVLDVENDEVYASDNQKLKLQKAPNDLCEDCLPRYEMVSSWQS